MIRFFSGVMLCLMTGVTYASDTTKVTEKSYELPKCERPIASVVVGKLVCKSAACQPAQAAAAAQANPLLQLAIAQAGGQQAANLAVVGDGMGAMLTTVLKETGCFDIQEREALEEMAKELALVGKKVEAQQADYMITGSITSISLSKERKSFGGGLIPFVGAISRTTEQAEIGLDIKVLDINRAKLVEAKTFQANNETSSMSLGGAAWGGGALFGGAMSSIKGTPMEPILRDVLAQVATFTATRMLSAHQAKQQPVSVGATPSADGPIPVAQPLTPAATPTPAVAAQPPASAPLQ